MDKYRFKFVFKNGTFKFLRIDNPVSLDGLLHAARCFFVIDLRNTLDFIDVYEDDKKMATFYR